jgi:hypothetical protein
VIWTLSNLTNASTPYNGDILKKPGIKVFHVTDFDPDSVCHTFIDCLKQLKSWSDANPRHVPITIDLELKTDAPACQLGGVCPGEATSTQKSSPSSPNPNSSGPTISARKISPSSSPSCSTAGRN